MEVRKRAKIEPIDLVLNLVILIEQAADAAHPFITGGAHAQLMALVSVALDIAPGRAWGEALRSRRSRTWIYALIVVHVEAACVVRVVLNLLDVAHEVGARIEEPHGTDPAVVSQRGSLN